MRMHLALGHGVIKPYRGANRFAGPIIGLAVRAVDVDVSA